VHRAGQDRIGWGRLAVSRTILPSLPACKTESACPEHKVLGSKAQLPATRTAGFPSRTHLLCTSFAPPFWTCGAARLGEAACIPFWFLISYKTRNRVIFWTLRGLERSYGSSVAPKPRSLLPLSDASSFSKPCVAPVAAGPHKVTLGQSAGFPVLVRGILGPRQSCPAWKSNLKRVRIQGDHTVAVVAAR
jgi:hypothetical protein